MREGGGFENIPELPSARLVGGEGGISKLVENFEKCNKGRGALRLKSFTVLAKLCHLLCLSANAKRPQEDSAEKITLSSLL